MLQAALESNLINLKWCSSWEILSEYTPLGRGVPAGCCQSDWASGQGSLPCWGTAWSSSSYGCDGWEHRTWTPPLLPRQCHTGLRQSDQQLERRREEKQTKVKQRGTHLISNSCCDPPSLFPLYCHKTSTLIPHLINNNIMYNDNYSPKYTAHIKCKRLCVEISFSDIPEVIAWLEEMQAMVTVWAGILSEKPAPSAA